MLPVAILAGGLATRLRPVTETIPKALIEVCGVPFIFRQLDYLRTQGVKKVVLCVGYLGDMIQAQVGDGSMFELDICYSYDGSILKGTGGALRQALPMLGEYFFVLYGDSFLPVDFRTIEDAFFKNQKMALMTVLKNGDCWDKSNVLFRDGKLLAYNKQHTLPEMTYIDYGLGVLTGSSVNSYSKEQSFDLAEVYQQLISEEQLVGYEVYQRFYEVGSFSGLKETEIYFSEKSVGEKNDRHVIFKLPH